MCVCVEGSDASAEVESAYSTAPAKLAVYKKT